MARRFNLLGFLRSAPNALLQEYFRQRELLSDFSWDGRKERNVEEIREAIVDLDPRVQDDVTADFQELRLRAKDGGFVKAILDEARYHGIDPDLPRRFEEMNSHLERAFWTFLHRKDIYWDGAHVIWKVDKVTNANQWTTRPGLPQRPGPVDEGVVADLQQTLIEHFKSEARGRRCQVEAYRRGGEEIFYAYPEDYKQTVSEYVGEKLEPKTVQPAFEIIFRHVDAEGRLDIHVEGDTVAPAILQVMFARAVLKEEIEEEYDEAQPTYELQPLLSRYFTFTWPDDVEIEGVVIKSLRLQIESERWQRVTVEADPIGRHEAVYDLLDRVTRELPGPLLTIDQVHLSVQFKRRPGDRRKPTRSVIITAPHTCRMIWDDRGEQVSRMLAASKIAVIPRAEADDASV